VVESTGIQMDSTEMEMTTDCWEEKRGRGGEDETKKA
jgi:hypothetical protein